MNEVVEANGLALAIKRMLAGRAVGVQGAALAGTMAIHLRSMPRDMSPTIAAAWLKTVWRLIAILERDEEREQLNPPPTPLADGASPRRGSLRTPCTPPRAALPSQSIWGGADEAKPES